MHKRRQNQWLLCSFTELKNNVFLILIRRRIIHNSMSLEYVKQNYLEYIFCCVVIIRYYTCLNLSIYIHI